MRNTERGEGERQRETEREREIEHMCTKLLVVHCVQQLYSTLPTSIQCHRRAWSHINIGYFTGNSIDVPVFLITNFHIVCNHSNKAYTLLHDNNFISTAVVVG